MSSFGRTSAYCLTVLLIGCVVGSFAGCGLPPVNLFDGGAPTAKAGTLYDDRDWATVLRENVKDGLVDYTHLQGHAGPLDRYLGILAVSGPESTPDAFRSRRARLAYYINAYNAGVLKAVLHEQVPDTMHDVRRRRLEHGYRLMLDGQVWTLAQVREAARTESRGDVRIEFCLCDAAQGSPPLPQQPLRPSTLEQQLRRAAQDAMDNRRMVDIDHEMERLNVSLAIRQHRGEFLDFHRRQTGTTAPTLLSALLYLAGDVRREWLNTAVGYGEGVIPFDRSLNRWTPSRSVSR